MDENGDVPPLRHHHPAPITALDKAAGKPDLFQRLPAAAVIITGFTDGWTSKEFLSSTAGVAISALTGGIPFTKFGGVSGVIDWGVDGLRSAPIIAARLEQELISPAIGVFTTKWDKATDTVSDTWDALTPW
ncbi:hypothetical protein [Streptomyces hirsutus]|uniref:hypothetical protein n=1 Tax=Streptomyces hirsutus TaxID=35620 RepID=UPI0033F1339C